MELPMPYYRPRRMRADARRRSLIRETTIAPEDFIYPLFVKPGKGVRDEVPSMPGVFQYSVDQLPAELDELRALGVDSIMLFGLPDHKDALGSGAYAADGIVQQAVAACKDHDPGMQVITDICLCEYTDHGHCGKLDEQGRVDNDATLELLARTAVSHAEAGADMCAPSDMMDGRVAALREALDQSGHADVPILSYAVKYASAFYGPFRDAADSAPAFGDRRAYQMDPANSDEALREARLDIEEGADLLMVKPALGYLDVLERVVDEFRFPTVAYNVSGEYALVKAAARNGWIDERRLVLEILLSIRRAGACAIITYHAKDAARWLREERDA
ncbi:MAG: porphobilinogen synthase [Coriobacteriales bacterium]